MPPASFVTPCQNRRRIYLLRDGELFPMLLSLPTGSLQEFTRYLVSLLTKGRKSNAVVTRFSLQKATNKGMNCCVNCGSHSFI